MLVHVIKGSRSLKTKLLVKYNTLYIIMYVIMTHKGP